MELKVISGVFPLASVVVGIGEVALVAVRARTSPGEQEAS